MTSPHSARIDQRIFPEVGSSFAGLAWPLAMVIVALLLTLPSGIFFGRQGIEKLLTALVLPVGLVWWTITAWMLLSWFQSGRNTRWKSTVAWIGVTVFTTAPIPALCMQRLETSVPLFEADQELPLDIVVVLGGGTRTGPNRSEVAESGDRVVYAAQLFLQGKCRHLITTGSAANTILGRTDDPYEQTLQIWTALGIPPTAISTLPGKNTYEEIWNLKEVFHEFKGQRVGLLTSASHLPRAMRLARGAGIDDLVPIAAHHTVSNQSYSISFFLPSAQNVEMMAVVQREWMGRLIGR